MEESPNLTYIYKLSNGNTTFAKSLVNILKKELSGEIKTYELHLANGDFTKSAGDVHKLCHKIKILGLQKGSKIAEEYSLDLLENNLKLKLVFERILTSMLLFIQKVKL